ncbi:MAG: hypothetical protein IKM06_06660 [Clostridia bacterium]|nr:hypothetical protein [Clostridia bacterium]
MTSILLLITMWLLICLLSFFTGYKLGKGRTKESTISSEAKRVLEREKRELENFFKYNGEVQG